MARSGLSEEDQPKARRSDYAFHGYTPIIGGTSPPVLFAHAQTIAAASTLTAVKASQDCYLGGMISLLNNSANAIVVSIYDGDPAGSAYHQITRLEAAGNAEVYFELGGAILCIKNGLYIVTTGTAPAAVLCLMINY